MTAHPDEVRSGVPGEAAGEAIRVVLVDDHELIRAGLAAAFMRDPGMRVVGQAGSVTEALDVIAATEPDVVVTDLQLPDGTGIDIVRRCRGDSAEIGLVLLTMHSGDDQIFAAMEAGASGFVGKDAPAAEVVRTAAHAARSPRTFVCAGLAQAMVRRMSGESTRLSEREHDILVLLADGLGTQQIARRLHVSESTAKSHIARIYQKLGATNRAQAVVTAMRIGLLSSVQPPRA
ncbi:response regulator transcription factor [Nocardioides sp. ChNu-153]|uniref:response regulator transcription factor n=1 Tax=unclassified Nocardioides TaxID=2615069 RepID=UPI002406B338|nr:MULTISPECIES: response regulator transcription factor [unclassified Nocardioides]MDF9715916.1 response regulator transcription factor [Nocardioides sp. ChNu-99]MDN7122909.1 response regulator transcription factor [Nocardioides sp. ChNu-153]